MATFDHIGFWLSLASDFVTVAIAVISLIAYLINRKKISTAIGLLLHKLFLERAGRLTNTLSRLSDLSCDDKAQRREVLALIGQARGQILPFAEKSPLFSDARTKIDAFLKSPQTLTEARKRELIAELQCAIESSFIAGAREG